MQKEHWVVSLLHLVFFPLEEEEEQKLVCCRNLYDRISGTVRFTSATLQRLLTVGRGVTSLEGHRQAKVIYLHDTMKWASGCGAVLTWQGFYRLCSGMQGVLLEGHPGWIRTAVTVNGNLVTVLCLYQRPTIWMTIDVNQSLKAPLVGFTVQTWNQAQLVRVLVLFELWPFDMAVLRAWAGKKTHRERESARDDRYT